MPPDQKFNKAEELTYLSINTAFTRLNLPGTNTLAYFAAATKNVLLDWHQGAWSNKSWVCEISTDGLQCQKTGVFPENKARFEYESYKYAIVMTTLDTYESKS